MAEKLQSDFGTVSSLESRTSDQPLKSLDITSLSSRPAAATSLHHSISYANTANTSASCDLRAHKSTSDMHAFMSSDVLSSEKSKDDLHVNDSVTSDTAGPELSCTVANDSLHTSSEILQSVSSCSSTHSVADKNSDSQITVETTASQSDCTTTHLLTDSTEALVPVQNHVHRNLATSVESSVVTGLSNSQNLNTDIAFDTVKDYSGADSLGLRVNIDLALESKGITATIMSPSEDFQSIYASNNTSTQTTSAVTDGTFISKPDTTCSYPDLDGADAWLEFPVPGKSSALSLCVSRRTAWYVDKAEHLYCSSLKGPGLTWNSVNQSTQQISCSPSGFIIWRVYRSSAFSAIGRITGKSPAGTEWREVAREVAYIAADDNVVW